MNTEDIWFIGYRWLPDKGVWLVSKYDQDWQGRRSHREEGWVEFKLKLEEVELSLDALCKLYPPPPEPREE